MSKPKVVKAPPRPEIKNINLFKDVINYRLPLAAKVSITHRVSGVILFFCLPFFVWLFSKTTSSAQDFADFVNFFHTGFLIFPAWLVKIGTVIFMLALFHYVYAGLRHTYIEVTHKTSKDFGRRSAIATFICSLGSTLIFALYLFLG